LKECPTTGFLYSPVSCEMAVNHRAQKRIALKR
jgi:hypothetical protein